MLTITDLLILACVTVVSAALIIAVDRISALEEENRALRRALMMEGRTH